MNITQRELELIEFIRELGWGEIKLRVENGQPVVIYEAIKTFKLGEKKLGDRAGEAKKQDKTRDKVEVTRKKPNAFISV